MTDSDNRLVNNHDRHRIYFSTVKILVQQNLVPIDRIDTLQSVIVMCQDIVKIKCKNRYI